MRFTQQAVAFVLFRAAVVDFIAYVVATAERSTLGRPKSDGSNVTVVFTRRRLAKGTLFFGQDDNGVKDDKGRVVPLESWPIANAKHQEFLSVLSGLTVISESFESQPQKPPFTIGEGIGVLDIHQKAKGGKVALGIIGTDAMFRGVYPTDGVKVLMMPMGSIAIANFTGSAPIVGFLAFLLQLAINILGSDTVVSNVELTGEYGLVNSGTNTLLECSVIRNILVDGIYQEEGSLTMNSTLVESAGGSGAYSSGGLFTMSCCELRECGASYSAGGILFEGSTVANIQDTIVIDNYSAGVSAHSSASTFIDVTSCTSDIASNGDFIDVESPDVFDGLTCNDDVFSGACESTCPGDYATMTVPADACAGVCTNGRGTY